MCAVHTLRLSMCVSLCACVCMCSRCAAVSYLRLCHRYVRSLKARPNDHYYHKHISNSRPSERFKLQFASALSCVYVCVCMYAAYVLLPFVVFVLAYILHFVFSYSLTSVHRTFHFTSFNFSDTKTNNVLFSCYCRRANVSLSISVSLSFSLFEFLSLLSLFAVGGTDNVDFAPFVILCDSNCCRFK